MRFVVVEGRSQGDVVDSGRRGSVEPWDVTPPPESARSRKLARFMTAQTPDNSIVRGRAGGGTPPHHGNQA